MTNKIIVIGYLGIKDCYLNIPEEEAMARHKTGCGEYCECDTEVVEFTDEFGAYDIWEA